MTRIQMMKWVAVSSAGIMFGGCATPGLLEQWVLFIGGLVAVGSIAT